MFMCPFLGDCPTFLQHINQSVDTYVLFNRNIVFFFSNKIGNPVSALETKFYKVVCVVFFFFLSTKHG